MCRSRQPGSRDKAHADADARHREALAEASIERQEPATRQSAQIFELLNQNTNLTRMTQELSQAIKDLTDETHRRVMAA